MPEPNEGGNIDLTSTKINSQRNSKSRNQVHLTNYHIIRAGVIMQLLVPLLHHPTLAIIVSLTQWQHKNTVHWINSNENKYIEICQYHNVLEFSGWQLSISESITTSKYGKGYCSLEQYHIIMILDIYIVPF